MWPFKKIKTTEDLGLVENTIIMARYTYETWNELFPESNDEEWEKATCPHSVAVFVNNFIDGCNSYDSKNISDVIIATIDYKYVEWLNKYDLTHSDNILQKYIQHVNRKKGYWTERLIESGMTETYSVFGIPLSMMVPNERKRRTSYVLSEYNQKEITKRLKQIYQLEDLYCPGWIVKGNELYKCIDDIVMVADAFWEEGRKIRVGRFLEQEYSVDEVLDPFKTLLYTVPFIVKTELDNATINMSYTKKMLFDQAMEDLEMIEYTKLQQLEISEILRDDLLELVSLGRNAVSPMRALILYCNKLITNKK